MTDKNSILERMRAIALNYPQLINQSSTLEPYYFSSVIQAFKKGRKIEIKKKNRGKFTASAKAHGMGVQEYARKVVNDPNATTLQKRRAQFALNSKKWSRH